MVCKIARAKLFEHLDGELEGRQRAALESHLAACLDCQRLVDVERSFREEYVEPLRPDRAPARVRERVAMLLDGLSGSSPEAARPRAFGRYAAAGLLLMLLGGLLGAGLSGLFRQGAASRAGHVSLVALADASVEQHQKLALGILPHDIQKVAPKAAEQWFKSRLNFNVSLPELSSEDLVLLGGRISHLRDLEVAALHYKLEGKDISLFVIPLQEYRGLGLGESPKFKVLTRERYDVIVWESHGAAYTLVSEIGGRACLVCHSREGKLDLPAGSGVHDKL